MGNSPIDRGFFARWKNGGWLGKGDEGKVWENGFRARKMFFFFFPFFFGGGRSLNRHICSGDVCCMLLGKQ